ncbi:MAG: hypothetical protein WA191_06765 [Telluria sp.]
MAEGDQTTLLPEWRQAVKDFLAAGFKEGDVVPHAWLERHFGMASLNEDEPILPADWNSRQFAWLRNIEAFRTELLEHHQIFLSSVIGQGYRLVPPREQSLMAQEKFEREAKRSYRRAANTLKHVRVAELTEGERRENMDAIAKIAMLRGMHKTAVE